MSALEVSDVIREAFMSEVVLEGRVAPVPGGAVPALERPLPGVLPLVHHQILHLLRAVVAMLAVETPLEPLSYMHHPVIVHNHPLVAPEVALSALELLFGGMRRLAVGSYCFLFGGLEIALETFVRLSWPLVAAVALVLPSPSLVQGFVFDQVFFLSGTVIAKPALVLSLSFSLSADHLIWIVAATASERPLPVLMLDQLVVRNGRLVLGSVLAVLALVHRPVHVHEELVLEQVGPAGASE